MIATVATALVALSAILAGLPFSFCHARSRAHVRPCCAHAQHDTADATHDHVDRGHCCDWKRVESPPSSAEHTPVCADVMPPPCVGLVPLEIAFASQGSVREREGRAWLFPARAGPAPPLFNLHRSYLN